MDMRGQAYRPWTKEDVGRQFRPMMERANTCGNREEADAEVSCAGKRMMKRKLMSITYTCSEDKINLGEADIMGYILQRLEELGAYDINMKASSADLAEPVKPVIPQPKELEIHIPEFMQARMVHGIGVSRCLQLVDELEGKTYGKTV